MKFNFSLFKFWCNCGNWNMNFKPLENFLKYAINPNKDNQAFYYSWQCKRCGKIIYKKIIVWKHDNEYFVKCDRL